MSDADCIFCKIISGAFGTEFIAENDHAVAFRDIQPQAPVHVLLIPRAHFDDLPSVADADPALAAEIVALAAEVARSEGVAATGHRLVANTGVDGGQSVPHAHVHLLGGRSLAWPPG